VTGLRASLLMAVLIVGCTPIPEDFGRTPSAGAGGSASAAPTPAASPGVTLGEGGKVTVVGQGQSVSESFELPAGKATLRITACQSNQVMPFITLLDGTGLGPLIVDPEKTVTIAGGAYRVQAQANPDCLWQVEITPGG
jgi:hypothetical protein